MKNKSVLTIVSIVVCLFVSRTAFPWDPIGKVADETLELYRQAMLLGDTTWAEAMNDTAPERQSKNIDNHPSPQQEEKDTVIFRTVNNSQGADDSESYRKMIIENPSTTEVGYLSPKTIEYLGDFDVTGVKNEDVVSSSNLAQSKATEKIYAETAKYKVTNIHTCTIIRGEVRAVCATFENLTDKTLRGVIIKIYLYDANGVRIGQVPLFEANVLPKEKVVFTSTIGDDIPAGIKSFKVLSVTENNHSVVDGM